nr:MULTISPECIES: GMC oxidoreductase [unclassified Sphingobium]
MRPESRGSIHIRSADPGSAPIIRANYLAAEEDRRVTVDALKICREIVAQPALAPFRGNETMPGLSLRTDEELLSYARTAGSTVYHPVGTCAMGPGPDDVVDHRLRVRGVEGLRVVDASIMPTLVSGNTNTPTIMIAEKASDLIAADLKI